MRDPHEPVYTIKRALNKRALYSVKRALRMCILYVEPFQLERAREVALRTQIYYQTSSAIKRALYSVKRALYSIKRALHICIRHLAPLRLERVREEART